MCVPSQNFGIVNEEEESFAALYSLMYRAYRACLRHKSHTLNAIAFRIREEREIYNLALSVWRREYILSPSIAFLVHNPCDREIIAAHFRDRVIQHYIVMRTNSLFDSSIDKEVYSCRSGMGNLAGQTSLFEKIYDASQGYTKPCYVYKFDLKGFFMSIDKRILLSMLENFVGENYKKWDKDIILYLLRITIMSSQTDDATLKSPRYEWLDLPKYKSLFFAEWWRGLAIGNLTSQLEANFYNRKFMAFLHGLGLDPVNYVDDFAGVVQDKEQFLRICVPQIKDFLKRELGLTLHPNKFYIQSYEKGINFIGCTIKKNRMYVSNRTVSNCYKKIHYYNENCLTFSQKRRNAEKFATILNSYLGFMIHYNSFNIRKKVADKVMPKWKDFLYFSSDFSKIIVKKKYKKTSFIEYWNKKKRKKRNARLKLFNNEIK